MPDLTKQQWWYRGEFTAPPAASGQREWLRFEGISYTAQIWVNGVQLDPDAEGTMIDHEYDVTDVVNPVAAHPLAILVTPPQHHCKDLSFCTVDWNPEAPDMNAGLSGRHSARDDGFVELRDPSVRTELPLPNTNSADLTVYANAVNGTDQPVTTTVDATISRSGHQPITLAQTVTLDPNEEREVVFDPAHYPALHVHHPDLWWPYQFGTLWSRADREPASRTDTATKDQGGEHAAPGSAMEFEDDLSFLIGIPSVTVCASVIG